MSALPTFIGRVTEVNGSAINVQISDFISSGLSIIRGTTYRIGQVGSFVRIPLGYIDLFGIVSEVGMNVINTTTEDNISGGAKWLRVQLVGEALGNLFERGIGQYPNVNDEVHVVTEEDLRKVYGAPGTGQIPIGKLSGAESIEVCLDLDKLVTRHSAILGSTGSGKSTTVASLLRSIVGEDKKSYPSSRLLLLDVHGEYSNALKDIAKTFQINATHNAEELNVPFWALETSDLIQFITGGVDEKHEISISDKILSLKEKTIQHQPILFSSNHPININTPIPFSLNQLWYELIDFELMTFHDTALTQSTHIKNGNALTLTPPLYQPHNAGSKGPYLNRNALGIKRQLNILRSKLIDRRFDFLLKPGAWTPDLNGKTNKTLSDLLESWLGHNKPITILDLSGVPSAIMERLIGSILNIIYEAIFWSREKSEGGIERPLLIVMEEAHRYLSGSNKNFAKEVVQRIVKEGRKFGVGAMIVSQRPSEVDETILSQCGTFFSMRLSNPTDRGKVAGAMPDNLTSLSDMLPVLRTGETIVVGEAARLPLRCRVRLPAKDMCPDSGDPLVSEKWKLKRRQEDYRRVVASWNAQSPRAVTHNQTIVRVPVSDGIDTPTHQEHTELKED
ncbi:ATP-binding protein [Lujinxingia sediminis]|uniref:ATP-binding protein n=1 Tax=Lujinxingia sediminis TaxID=2480984 RepID=A0ABY0CRF9_9DELT|nr:ATP-binding protein [Lujinxingia sediminis]RVU43160.1 ATP-binding protein [Lujinxingia sediminis]